MALQLDGLAESLANEGEEAPTERGHACLALDLSSLFDSETVSDVVLDLEGAGGEVTALPSHRVVLVAGAWTGAEGAPLAWP